MSKNINQLDERHYEVMAAVKGGATIYGYGDALRLREVQAFDPRIINIVPVSELKHITGEAFKGSERLPYFGAILTEQGRNELKIRTKK